MGIRMLENISNDTAMVIEQFPGSQRWTFFGILNSVGRHIASVNSTPECDETFLQDVFLLLFCVTTSAVRRPTKVT